VFILEHYFTSKSFAAVREAFTMRILTRKYRIREQYTDWQQNFGTQEGFVCYKCSLSDKTAQTTPYRSQAVRQLQQWDAGARTQHCHWFRRFVHEGIHV
jgi:hypothetical protein